jgi:hypothetical protein
LFSGPGVGKSKLAYFLADQLGREGFNIELSAETIKPRAYRGDWPSPWENFTQILAPQLEQERDWLESGVKHVVTDSPIFLQCFYMAGRNARPTIGCLHLARAWEEEHPAVNVFLVRSDKIQFEQAGRYQDLKESKKIDASLMSFLDTEGVECEFIDAHDRPAILEFIREALRSERPTPFRMAA